MKHYEKDDGKRGAQCDRWALAVRRRTGGPTILWCRIDPRASRGGERHFVRLRVQLRQLGLSVAQKIHLRQMRTARDVLQARFQCERGAPCLHAVMRSQRRVMTVSVGSDSGVLRGHRSPIHREDQVVQNSAGEFFLRRTQFLRIKPSILVGVKFREAREFKRIETEFKMDVVLVRDHEDVADGQSVGRRAQVEPHQHACREYCSHESESTHSLTPVLIPADPTDLNGSPPLPIS